jgi:hypothetical protein
MRSAPVLVVLVLLCACSAPGATGDPTDSPPAGEAPVLVIAEGDPGDEPGLSVAEALTHGPTDDLVTVTGALFVDADGTARLCDAILESFPPQCGGDRIEVEGLDLDTIPNLETEGDLSWAEGVTLFGSVE